MPAIGGGAGRLQRLGEDRGGEEVRLVLTTVAAVLSLEAGCGRGYGTGRCGQGMTQGRESQ